MRPSLIRWPKPTSIMEMWTRLLRPRPVPSSWRRVRRWRKIPVCRSAWNSIKRRRNSLAFPLQASVPGWVQGLVLVSGSQEPVDPHQNQHAHTSQEGGSDALYKGHRFRTGELAGEDHNGGDGTHGASEMGCHGSQGS